VDSPMLPELARMAQGRRLVACASAAQHFQSIVAAVGGPLEQQRARRRLGQVKTFQGDLPGTEEESLDQSVQSGRPS